MKNSAREHMLAGALLLVCVSWAAWDLTQQHRPSQRGSRPGETNTEAVVVMVGSSSCEIASDPGLRRHVRNLFALLSAEADAKGVSLRRIGVSVDEHPEDGLDFLRGVSEFDELLVGGGWNGVGAMQFVTETFRGQRVVPQLIAIQRVRDSQGFWTETRLLRRKIGAVEISAWRPRDVWLSSDWRGEN